MGFILLYMVEAHDRLAVTLGRMGCLVSDPLAMVWALGDTGTDCLVVRALGSLGDVFDSAVQFRPCQLSVVYLGHRTGIGRLPVTRCPPATAR